MRTVRSAGLGLLLTVLCLTTLSVGPARADHDRDDHRGRWRGGHYNSWYGRNNYPYYWNNTRNYSPYRAYSPYQNWYGTSGGYYGNYPYYTATRNYPWGWRW